MLDFKKILLRQKRDLEKEISSVKKEDPLNSDDLVETSEPGTDSFFAEVHGKVTAIKQNLENLLSNTTKALMNLKKGKYGKCEVCGKQIEEERLKIIPTTELCLKHSKTTKKS